MKRERSPVSRETHNEILHYLMRHWPSVFQDGEQMMTSRMQVLKPLCKGPWAVTVGGKRRPLMRVRTSELQFVVEPFGNNGWRLGVVRIETTHGMRVMRRSSRARWTDVRDDELLDYASRRFLDRFPYGFGGGEEQTLFFDSFEWDDACMEIKFTHRHRAGMSLFDADMQTLQRWIVQDHGIEPNTRYTDGFNQLVSRLCERERPTESQVVIVEGQSILEAYAKEEGAHSCMSGRCHSDKVELYSLNPDQCKMALIYEAGADKSRTRAIIRCLIWVKKENGKTVWFVDRAYPPRGKTTNILRTALNFHVDQLDEDIELRWFREEEYMSDDDGYYDDDEYNEDDYDARHGGDDAPIKMNPVFRLRLPGSLIMPYMDTLIWGQMLSDNTGLFARTPNRLIPFGKGSEKQRNRCPIKLEDGVKPITHPEEMCDTEGGIWQDMWRRCTYCGEEYNARPPEYYDGLQGHWTVNACESCFEEKYVMCWAERDAVGVVGRCEEPPVLKCDAFWSENLQAHVNTHGFNCRYYLVWDPEEEDYFHKDDPKVKKKDCEQRRSRTQASPHVPS